MLIVHRIYAHKSSVTDRPRSDRDMLLLISSSFSLPLSLLVHVSHISARIQQIPPQIGPKHKVKCSISCIPVYAVETKQPATARFISSQIPEARGRHMPKQRESQDDTRKKISRQTGKKPSYEHEFQTRRDSRKKKRIYRAGLPFSMA